MFYVAKRKKSPVMRRLRRVTRIISYYRTIGMTSLN